MSVQVPLWFAWTLVGLYVFVGANELLSLVRDDYSAPKKRSRGLDAFGLVCSLLWIATWLHFIGSAA